MKRWFLPEIPDLLGLLNRQADVVKDGIEAFAAWSHGTGAGDVVHAAAGGSGDAKRDLQMSLRSAFSTPLDPEDIYELSERLDAVVESAKNVVREADAIAIAPDPAMGRMADALVVGVGHLRTAFDALGHDDAAASDAADAAVDACRTIEELYSSAMSSLLAIDDLREVMGRRELYRRYVRTADAVEQVAERVWYALVKSP